MPPRKLTRQPVEPTGPDEVEFDLPRHRLRVMFHDGATLDVLTRCTDSRVNEFAFQHHYGHKTSAKGDNDERIVGIADLGEDPGKNP